MEGDGRWIINLGNSICGVSLLALPYCYSQCGVILGSGLLISSAIFTYWSCQLLIDCIFSTKTISYEGIAHKVYGSYGKLLLEISSVFLMVGTCSAFFVIIADLAPMVFSWLTDIPSTTPYLKGIILLSLAISVVFPLSLLRQLDSLSVVSTVSLCFYAWLTLQLIVYAFQKVGSADIAVWRMGGIFHAVPIYAMAFACHLQLVAIIKEIVGEIHEGDNESCSRIKNISKWAVSVVAVVYGSAALFGHIAFSASGVQGDVLANFDNGIMAQTTRIGFTLSVIVSFPFMVHPCRSTLNSFFFGKSETYIPSPKHLYITIGILTLSFLVAVYTPNVELVLTLTGSICGATICYIFPSLSYLFVVKEGRNKWKAIVILVIGIFLLLGGTMASLLPAPSHDSNVIIDTLGVNQKPLDLHGPPLALNDKVKEIVTDDKKDGIKTLRVLTSKHTNTSSAQQEQPLPLVKTELEKPALKEPELEKPPVQEPVLDKKEPELGKQEPVLGVKEPVVDKPVIHEHVIEKPAVESVQKRSPPAKELLSKNGLSQELVKQGKGSFEKSADQATDKQSVQEPQYRKSSAIEEPVIGKQQNPAVQGSARKSAAAQEPAPDVQKSAAQKPVPAIQKHAAQEPASAIQKPAVQEPAPVIQKPAAEEPAMQKPAAVHEQEILKSDVQEKEREHVTIL